MDRVKLVFLSAFWDRCYGVRREIHRLGLGNPGHEIVAIIAAHNLCLRRSKSDPPLAVLIRKKPFGLILLFSAASGGDAVVFLVVA